MNDSLFKTHEKTKTWLEAMGVKSYTIRDDLTVDVDGDVDISFKKLKKIPVQFGVVSGVFNCNENKLISLKGSPRRCAMFQCCRNQIVNLINAPDECGLFDCSDNHLFSLEGAPKTVANFNCSHCRLTSLKWSPVACARFVCDGNLLADLDGAPIECNDFYCGNNPLTSLDGVPKKCSEIHCYWSPMLSDISAVPDGCKLFYDHDVVARNRTDNHLTDLGKSNGVIGLPIKPSRAL